MRVHFASWVTPRTLPPTAILGCCLLFLSLIVDRQPKQHGFGLPPHDRAPSSSDMKTEGGKKDVQPTLQGVAAVEYLKETHDGRSLAEAVTAARFGLKWQERSPFESSTNLSLSNKDGGYLGMSHVLNLSAWFDDQGVTIRPNKFEGEKGTVWNFGMKLKAYGYGKQLLNAPEIISRNVKDNRIEYERRDCRLPIANCQFENPAVADVNSNTAPLSSTYPSTIGNRKSAMVEWYENRASGIEQGFTLNAPPRRMSVGNGEPLRLVVALKGDLSAAVKEDGSSVELVSKNGDAVLSYGQLVAKDARGRKLPAHIEGNAQRDEIALVVDDKDAAYPVEIDPITASLEQKLTAPSQGASEFGDAVAIKGNVAVLGAFREDNISASDVGRVYIFTRTGSTWTFKYSNTLGTPSAECGWSVAIGDEHTVAFGCPGDNSNTGSAELLTTTNEWSTATVNVVPLSVPRGNRPEPGDRYGESIALGYGIVVVGAPFTDSHLAPPQNFQDVGAFYYFKIDSSTPVTFVSSFVSGEGTGAEFGTSLAIDAFDSIHMVVGEPGYDSQTGKALVFELTTLPDGSNDWTQTNNFFGDLGTPGDVFGYSVSISGNTAVVGAPLNDNAKGTDAGAAYVFIRDSQGTWRRQQKLIPSDGIEKDQFGESVAIEGNTIIVGSPYNGSKAFVGTRGNGRSYVFTRSNDTWTEQTIISALFDGSPADKFGIAVAFSGDTVISGAEHAPVGNQSDAGAAYIHRLSCVPPGLFQTVDLLGAHSGSICQGTGLLLINTRDSGEYVVGTEPFTYQWRKNGVNIPGATNFAFKIENVSAADAGVYDFIVSNSCATEISQPYNLSVFKFTAFPSGMNIGYPGATGLLSVQTASGCTWSAQSNDSWITITSGSSGTGNGDVAFKVDPNTSTSPRTGTMTVARGIVTVTVMQDGAPNAPPNILIETGTVNRAVAVDSVTFVHGPFSIFDDHNFSGDRHTRVIIFTSDLGLSQPDSSILTVRAGVFPLTVENVGTLTGVAGLSASFIVVRLPDGLLTGDLPLTVTLRGVASSNNPTISISP